MAPTRRRSSSRSLNSQEDPHHQDGNNNDDATTNGPPPPKKRKMDKEVPPLDPNAIDHSLDLAAAVVVAPPPPAASSAANADLDAFPLFDDLVHEAIMPALEQEDNEANNSQTGAGEEEGSTNGSTSNNNNNQHASKKKMAKRRNSASSSVEGAIIVKPKKKKPAMTVEQIKKKYSPKRLARILQKAIQDARESHEEERERVERQLPDEVKSNFGQIGFGRFGQKVCVSKFCGVSPIAFQ